MSIIIPIYNAADHLARTIDSVLAQTYPSIELVLIDDGSTDDSPAIVDEYAARLGTQHCVAVHQANAGAAQARNAGLDAATGDLIMWLDADDWMEPDWVAMFVDAQQSSGADIVACGKTSSADDTRLLQHPDPLEAYLLNRVEKTMWVTCAKAQVYEGHRFESFTIGEDALMLCHLMWGVQTLCIIPRTDGYHYEDVSTSISREQRLGNRLDWPKRANAELAFIESACPQYRRLALFDIMRGAGVMYRSTKRLQVPNQEQQTKQHLLAILRRYICRGILRPPVKYMKPADYRQILVALRDLLC
ncbi:glycosyltransferase, group 2 family protein [Bifidobacterium gallicum DSM 20093 = LMG 11596]|uniref:Glycosyltransferase, group 2 family protein n=1 Tax=Bifidobacterium gallicum DSM 20093 = LMG 11596 TaxID=561180 RepID=D1NRT8_9BIFI|nr:glycosyltransferase, group 2 family protein [Bifidobacterium gallicum DSM 20093 = LMG 11596]